MHGEATASINDPRPLPMHFVLLTLVPALPQGVTSLTQQYDNQAACEEAAALMRERLATGRVVLLTCTPTYK